MERIYHHYKKWEDWQNGMYGEGDKKKEGQLIKSAVDLLSNPSKLYVAMFQVATKWKHAAEVNLTNKSRNRRAWLGQAACCYEHKVPEILTKTSWWMLDEKTQNEANSIATKVILEWEKLQDEKGDNQLCLKFT